MSYNFKYADLLDDEVFKLVFGRDSSKDVMIEFLNQVIPDRKIEDLEFIDKEMHPLERDSKGSVYDNFLSFFENNDVIVDVNKINHDGSTCFAPLRFFMKFKGQADTGGGVSLSSLAKGLATKSSSAPVENRNVYVGLEPVEEEL